MSVAARHLAARVGPLLRDLFTPSGRPYSIAVTGPSLRATITYIARDTSTTFPRHVP